MLENSFEIIFAVVGSLWISCSLISSFKNYAYVKKKDERENYIVLKNFGCKFEEGEA